MLCFRKKIHYKVATCSMMDAKALPTYTGPSAEEEAGTS